MWSFFLKWSFWMKWRRSSGRGKRRTPTPWFRPRLEALEDRLAPATFTVTSTADPTTITSGTLRWAIQQVNGSSDPSDTIVLQATGTYQLTQGQLTINPTTVPSGGKTITIQGNSPANTVIQQTTANRVLEIDGNNNGLHVLFQNLAITGGSVSNANGGNIWLNDSSQSPGVDSVALTNVLLTSGTASGTGNGGGIASSTGNIILTGSIVQQNTAGAAGGGLYTQKGSIQLVNSILSGNTAGTRGGGIYNDGQNAAATLSITASHIDSNTAGAGGGGIYDGSTAGQLTLDSSTVSNNIAGLSAAGNGGGIFAQDQTITITNSVLNGNQDGNGSGGALYTTGGSGSSLTLSGSILNGNTASGQGGAIYNSQQTVSITGSMIDGNSSGSDGGGMYNTGVNSLTVSNTDLSGNIAQGQGGGLFLSGSSSGTSSFVGSTVNNDAAAGNGGGLCILTGSLTLNTVSLNTDRGASGGGLYYAGGGSLSILNTIIVNNIATAGAGGGVNDTSSTNLNISGSIISGNIASGNGGGMNAVATTTNIVGSNFNNDAATGGSASGGGFNLAGNNSLTVQNVAFINDKATVQGGGLGVSGGSLSFDTAVISSNNAGTGGGLYSAGTGSLSFFNTTIINNLASTGAGGGVEDTGSTSLTISGSIINGNASAGNGGGFDTAASSGQVIGSAINNNKAVNTNATGGGLNFRGSGALNIQNSTLLNNQAGKSGGGVYYGGQFSSGVNILNSLQGLTFTDDASPLVPPDTIAAVGPSHVVELVNAVIAFYDKTTGQRLFLKQFSDFFAPLGTTSQSFLFDPVVTYDEAIGRFVLGVLEGLGNNTYSDFLVAVSNDSNPLDGFSMVRIPAISTSDFLDYPKLGWNADAVVFTFNDFVNGLYDHVEVLAIDPLQLSTFYFTALSGNHFTLVPAVMHGATPGSPLWLVEGDGTNFNSNQVHILKMTNVLSAIPTFTSFTLTVSNYGNPPPAPEPGGNQMQTNDSRMLNAEWRSNQLVASQTVDAGGIAQARWYEFSTSGASPTLLQEGQINRGPGVATYFPSVAIAPDGSIGMTFMESSSTEFVSMYVTGRLPTDPIGTMEPPILVKGGEDQYVAFDASPYRAGDYSGTIVDPVDGTFWSANEYATPQNGIANWGTWIAHYKVAGVNTAATVLTIGNSILNNNVASTGNGGAVAAVFGGSNSGLTISGSILQNNVAYNSGGAVASAQQTVNISASNFNNNVSGHVINTPSGTVVSGSGGAFYDSGSSNFQVANSDFSGNQSVNGGGIALNSTTANPAALFTNVTVNANFAAGGNGGGLNVQVPNVNLTLQQVTIQNNKASGINATTGGDGGGIYSLSNGAVIAINGSAIINNQGNNGGGISERGSQKLTIVNSNLNNNIALGSGGGLLTTSINATLLTCSFDGEVALGNGGGLAYLGTGTLLANACSFNNDVSSSFGAGAYLRGGTVTFKNASITNDIASSGGGIYFEVNSSSSLTVDHGNISNNVALNKDGGGVFSGADINTIQYVSITNNQAKQRGGGIAFIPNFDIAQQFNVSNSLIANNQAGTLGGGIFADGIPAQVISFGNDMWEVIPGTTLNLTNSTVFGNHADRGGGIALGTDVASQGVTGNFLFDTIDANSATSFGGGIWNGTRIQADQNTQIPAPAYLGNSLIAANTAPAQANGPDLFGTLLSRTKPTFDFADMSVNGDIIGHNIIGTPLGAGYNNLQASEGDQFNVTNPGLNPLANNGGPTLTQSLQPGSPALRNALFDINVQSITTIDQRGVQRPQPINAVNADVGAFESGLQ